MSKKISIQELIQRSDKVKEDYDNLQSEVDIDLLEKEINEFEKLNIFPDFGQKEAENLIYKLSKKNAAEDLERHLKSEMVSNGKLNSDFLSSFINYAKNKRTKKIKTKHLRKRKK